MAELEGNEGWVCERYAKLPHRSVVVALLPTLTPQASSFQGLLFGQTRQNPCGGKSWVALQCIMLSLFRLGGDPPFLRTVSLKSQTVKLRVEVPKMTGTPVSRPVFMIP